MKIGRPVNNWSDPFQIGSKVGNRVVTYICYSRFYRYQCRVANVTKYKIINELLSIATVGHNKKLQFRLRRTIVLR